MAEAIAFYRLRYSTIAGIGKSYMNILLTNDDGYNAEGLQVLFKKLSQEPRYNLYISAPLGQKSAVGHGVTLFKPMKYIEIQNGYAVDGTPADCIKTAVFGFFKDVKFDLVLSGINKGMNMGHDIFYSGTVAGAREALINDISGIACSRKWDWEEKYTSYESSADFMLEMIKDLEKAISKEKLFLNVNFPSEPEFKGVRISHLGNRLYDDTIYYSEENGDNFVSIVGNGVTFKKSEGSDLDLIDQGYVSITPLIETKKNVDFILKEKLSEYIKTY
jgi:5'-nucleotidase